MKTLAINFRLSSDLMHSRVAISYLFEYLKTNAVIVTPHNNQCLNSDIPSSYKKSYIVCFRCKDGYNIYYSFYFSTRSRKVFVFQTDPLDGTLYEIGYYYNYIL